MDYHLTVVSTVDDGKGGPFTIEGIGKFVPESSIDPWIEGFWVELDKMNERLGLEAEPIGAEIIPNCYPFGRRGTRRTVDAWTPESTVGVIEEQYKRINGRVVASPDQAA